MSAGVFAREQIRVLAERFHAEVKRASEKTSPEVIHDVRVATRRLRQALRVFGPLTDKKAAKRARRELKPLIEAGGAVRDCDIAMQLFSDAHLSRQHPLWDELRAERAGAETRFRKRVEKARRAPDLPARDDARLPAPALLVPKYFRQGRAATQPGIPPGELHAFRLATKRLRYTLELFKPLYGPALATRIEDLRKIQEILGNANDAVVSAARLRARARRDPALEPATRTLERRVSRLQSEFRALWRRQMDAPGNEQRWVAYLRRRKRP